MMGEEFIRKIHSCVLLEGNVILTNRIHMEFIQELMCLMEWLNLNVVQYLEVLHYLQTVSH